MFGGVDWSAWPEQGDRFGEWAAARLRAQASRGAAGAQDLEAVGAAGARPARMRWSPWMTRGSIRSGPRPAELDLPVMIHVADPVAFFDPLDEPQRALGGAARSPRLAVPQPALPAFPGIVNGMANVVARHPKTTFIGAHVGCYAENLGWVGALLDRCPNFYIDIAERMAELGRQPYAARRFFMKYADRILFGLDQPAKSKRIASTTASWRRRTNTSTIRSGPTPPQGRWQIYGLHLPDEVLEKVYHTNAARLLHLR